MSFLNILVILEVLEFFFQTRPINQAAFLDAPSRSLLERRFLDYLVAGGFPEAQGLDPSTRFQLLRDCLDVAILRDEVEWHAVSNVAGLRWLVRHLLGNAAGLFSVEKFSDRA